MSFASSSGIAKSKGAVLPLRFGECIFEGDCRQLTRGGAPQDISPKAFQLLELLLEARPRALSKQELHDRLWPDAFVSDSSLPRLVAEVRDAIGDDARQPRLLRTIHRFGYAFFGAVTVQETEPAAGLPLCRLVWGERQIALHQGENILGRSADARVWIDFARVSRHHARIVVEGGGATLEDLGSKNGTFVRGERVTGPARLRDGDDICIGAVVLVFRTSIGRGTTETGTAA